MKKAFMRLLPFLAIALSGCSTVDTCLEKVILTRSGILEQEDYIQYQQYQAAGRLNEAGQYVSPDLSENSSDAQGKPDGQIHVTFADNHYLTIYYYTDSAMTIPIDTDRCYINPGDTLYAQVMECDNPNSNLYRLAEYRLIEYDAEGNRKTEYNSEVSDDIWEYQLPTSFTGTEISVIPVGEYPDRNLSMNVYYMDDSSNECSLENAGTWSVNNYDIKENTAKIRSTESYVLKFTYDTENYFYVGCRPECFTKDPGADGFVEFWEAKPTETDMTYQVELHPFLNLALKFEKEAQVRINQGNAETIRKNKIWSLGKLQYGDCITIETAGECTITDGDYRHIKAARDPVTDGYRYTLTVIPEAKGNAANALTSTIHVNRSFPVTLDTNCDYGTCTYKLDGTEVSGAIHVQEGQELTLTCQITKDKYSFADKHKGIGEFFRDLIHSSERTVTIPITADLEGTTINPDDWFDIIEKGE